MYIYIYMKICYSYIDVDPIYKEKIFEHKKN